MIGEFIAHDSIPQLGSLNHRGSAKCNALSPVPRYIAFGEKRASPNPQPPPNPSKMTRLRNVACVSGQRFYAVLSGSGFSPVGVLCQ
jgi:hypothetical protein